MCTQYGGTTEVAIFHTITICPISNSSSIHRRAVHGEVLCNSKSNIRILRTSWCSTTLKLQSSSLELGIYRWSLAVPLWFTRCSSPWWHNDASKAVMWCCSSSFNEFQKKTTIRMRLTCEYADEICRFRDLGIFLKEIQKATWVIIIFSVFYGLPHCCNKFRSKWLQPCSWKKHWWQSYHSIALRSFNQSLLISYWRWAAKWCAIHVHSTASRD